MRRWRVVSVFAALAAVGTAAIAHAASQQSSFREPPSLRARFDALSRTRTNRCNLTPAEVLAMPVSRPLQGSCCLPMDFATYRTQLKRLSRYAAVPEIARDPYDVSAQLAKRLTAYDRITLSSTQQATFHRAMQMNNRHGPCCCLCWRWTAFSGQAKFLLVHRRYTATQVAFIWKAEDGCGGKSQ